METLEEELLAVTERRSKYSRKDDSDASASAGEFDDAVDSDGAEDDTLDDAHYDDGDDDEYGIDDDDDDEEFGGRSSKKKSSRPSKAKSSGAKIKSSRARPRSSDKKTSKSKQRRSPSLSREDDADRFSYEYDEDGYGDADDREQLSQMNEVERETILTERKDARNKKFVIWQKKRELMAREVETQPQSSHNRGRSSGRSKAQSQSKTDALDALAEDIRKKSSRAINPVDVSDDDSEQEQPKVTKLDSIKQDLTQEIKADQDLMLESEGPDLRYEDLVKEGSEGSATTTTPLFLRRDILVHLSQKPYFARVVQGLYVRLRVGSKDNSYLLCRIVGVKSGRVYEVMDSQMNKFKTNQFLVLLSGKQRRLFEIRILSGSHPKQHEFDVYVSRAKGGGTEIPRRDEVKRLLKEATANIFEGKAVATDEERKEHMANLEMVYPARVNWTQKRTELETALEIKQQDFSNGRRQGMSEQDHKNYAEEIKDMETRLKEIRAMETKYVFQEKTSNTEVFENLARRNMKLNATNESLAAKRRSFEAGRASLEANRVDGASQLYSRGERENGGRASNGVGPEHMKGWSAAHDWRLELLSWSPGRKRKRLGDNPLSPEYDVEVPDMDDIEFDEFHKAGLRSTVSLVPPGIDAVYDRPTRPLYKAPLGAKIISLEEWSKQREA